MTKTLTPDVESRMDKAMALIRKCIVASRKSSLMEAHITVYLDTVDFNFAFKNSAGNPNAVNETYSLRLDYGSGFDEEYNSLNYKVNHFLKKGVLPI